MFESLLAMIQNQDCVKSVVDTEDGFQVVFPMVHRNSSREAGLQLGVWEVNGQISTTTAFYQSEGDEFHCSYFDFQDEPSAFRDLCSFLDLSSPPIPVEDFSNVANIIQELLLCIKLKNAIPPSALNAFSSLH